MPLLKKHKLVITQPLSCLDGRPAIRTILHCADTEDELMDTVILPDLDDPQKMGSCITYYRRYSLQSLLGLQAEDDDGNKASTYKKPAEVKIEDVKDCVFVKLKYLQDIADWKKADTHLTNLGAKVITKGKAKLYAVPKDNQEWGEITKFIDKVADKDGNVLPFFVSDGDNVDPMPF
jgi:hypothetical protein